MIGGSTPGALAVGLGATMLAFTALGKMTASISALVDAAIGWRQVGPLLKALRTPEPLGHVDAIEPLGTIKTTPRGALIVAQDLAYRFRDRMEPVLQHCGFRILAGDRIHLTGVSGAGKSTLVSLLTGLRVPDAGFLLLDGLDRATLGAKAWKRRVAAAPQFHELVVLDESFAELDPVSLSLCAREATQPPASWSSRTHRVSEVGGEATRVSPVRAPRTGRRPPKRMHIPDGLRADDLMRG